MVTFLVFLLIFLLIGNANALRHLKCNGKISYVHTYFKVYTHIYTRLAIAYHVSHNWLNVHDCNFSGSIA